MKKTKNYYVALNFEEKKVYVGKTSCRYIKQAFFRVCKYHNWDYDNFLIMSGTEQGIFLPLLWKLEEDGYDDEFQVLLVILEELEKWNLNDFDCLNSGHIGRFITNGINPELNLLKIILNGGFKNEN